VRGLSYVKINNNLYNSLLLYLLLHLQELKTNASSKPEEDIKEVFDNIDKAFIEEKIIPMKLGTDKSISMSLEDQISLKIKPLYENS
jgi:hypothetical protein